MPQKIDYHHEGERAEVQSVRSAVDGLCQALGMIRESEFLARMGIADDPDYGPRAAAGHGCTKQYEPSQEFIQQARPRTPQQPFDRSWYITGGAMASNPYAALAAAAHAPLETPGDNVWLLHPGIYTGVSGVQVGDGIVDITIIEVEAGYGYEARVAIDHKVRPNEYRSCRPPGTLGYLRGAPSPNRVHHGIVQLVSTTNAPQQPEATLDVNVEYAKSPTALRLVESLELLFPE